MTLDCSRLISVRRVRGVQLYYYLVRFQPPCVCARARAGARRRARNRDYSRRALFILIFILCSRHRAPPVRVRDCIVTVDGLLHIIMVLYLHLSRNMRLHIFPEQPDSQINTGPGPG